VSAEEVGPQFFLADDDDDTIMSLATENPVIGESLSKKELRFGSLSLASERNPDIQKDNPDSPKQVSKPLSDQPVLSTESDDDIFQLEKETHGEYLGYEIARDNGITRSMKKKDSQGSEEDCIEAKVPASEISFEIASQLSESSMSGETYETDVAKMIREWEYQLLNLHDPNARIVIRVGQDGRDEYRREPYSKERFTLIAKDIVATGPTTDPTKQAKDSSKGNWRGTQVNQIY
jgi:hypothetical protein